MRFLENPRRLRYPFSPPRLYGTRLARELLAAFCNDYAQPFTYRNSTKDKKAPPASQTPKENVSERLRPM